MGVTNYISVNGMIISESASGINRAYGLDALGSVVGTYSGSSVENTYQYKPYGGLLAKSGVAADPSYLWNGGNGYRKSGFPFISHYVRARHYSFESGRWTSNDPLWPRQPAYMYAKCSPIGRIDPSGLRCSNVSSPSTCKTSLTKKGAPHVEIRPATGGKGWDVIAVLDVGFVCVNTCDPCPCPSHGTVPTIDIQQWYYDGPVQSSPSWTSDGSQSCGKATVNGCTTTQNGRDTPGYGLNDWNPLLGCDVDFKFATFTDNELPAYVEIHYVTLCHPGRNFDMPPANEPTSLYWGIKVHVVGPPPDAYVTETSP